MRGSTLKKYPEFDFGLQVDRDRTSHMKEQFMYMKNVRDEEEAKRI